MQLAKINALLFVNFVGIGGCKKICVNDILPMTFKGNYHEHKQQIYKSTPATTNGAG
jgi:hypothetical protein